MSAGKGGAKGRKGHSSEEDGGESLDEIAGLADTKARFDKVLEVSLFPLKMLQGRFGYLGKAETEGGGLRFETQEG